MVQDYQKIWAGFCGSLSKIRSVAVSKELAMASDIKGAVLFAYRANIDRYRRILETHLTVEERRVAERHLAEEQTSLERLMAINDAV